MSIKTFLVRRVHRGERFPRFFGRAWVSWCDDATVAVPIPLNVVVGFLRWLYFATLHGWPRHHHDAHSRRFDMCVCRRCGRLMRDPPSGPWRQQEFP